MDRYKLTLTIIGFAALGMAWMPKFTKKTGISYAIVYVLAGFIIYTCFPNALTVPDPRTQPEYAQHLTEIVILLALMGTGIKIDRKFSFKSWRSPIRLVTIAMVLCIGCATLLGYYLLGIGLIGALLLGAVLAPTDPVLASDVQVGPPNEQRRFEIKFSLTAEAGLNDGMAFPFVMLAIIASGMPGGMDGTAVMKWLSIDLIYRIWAGVLIGFVIGRAAGYSLFKIPDKYEYLEVKDGFVSLSMTLLVFGVAELLNTYGFIAVFVAAITLRHYEKEHLFHNKLYSIADQMERCLVAILLLLFGGSLTTGILSALTWKGALFSIIFIFIIRPLAGYISLWGMNMDREEKWVIGFFGIRGMGTIYYLAFAMNHGNFPMANELWAVATFTILLSLVIHGLSASRVMQHMESKYATRIVKKVE